MLDVPNEACHRNAFHLFKQAFKVIKKMEVVPMEIDAPEFSVESKSIEHVQEHIGDGQEEATKHQSDWLQVQFKPASVFDNMWISREPAKGKDIIIDRGHEHRFQPIGRNGNIQRKIDGRLRVISVHLIRRMHYEYPEWCHLIDFTKDDCCELLRDHLLTQTNRKGYPLWALVNGHPRFIVNRSGTLVIGGTTVVRAPTKMYDYYYIYFKAKAKVIHRVVWEAFNQKIIPFGCTIDHKNRDPTDNRLENLRIATPSEQAVNRKKRKSAPCWDREIEVFSPVANDWVTYANKFEVFAKIPEINHSLFKKLMRGETRPGIMARYKEIAPLRDANGKPEEWKEIPGTKYWVSNLPDFQSKMKPDGTNEIPKGVRISTITELGIRIRVKLAPRVGDGYCTVIDRNGKCHKLHRLVYIVFNGPIPEGYDIDHIDGDKSNNFWQNLQALSKQKHAEKTRGRPVVMDGVRYPSIKAAAEVSGESWNSLVLRLKDGNDPNLKFASDTDTSNPTTMRPRIPDHTKLPSTPDETSQ